jgi:hypothetical protein
LHRAFHADSSYSYTYHGTAGYLDHALCNTSLYPQVTGMVAYHINSDENDKYTYDKSNDETMFRCSDHDPVIVGLKLDSNAIYVPETNKTQVYVGYENGTLYLYNAEGGAYRIYSWNGKSLTTDYQVVTSNQEPLQGLKNGLYIISTYSHGTSKNIKIIIP